MFLQDAVADRNAAEDALVEADRLFESYEQTANYDTSPIYAANKSDDEPPAMFEMQDQLDSEAEIDSDPLSEEELKAKRAQASE